MSSTTKLSPDAIAPQFSGRFTELVPDGGAAVFGSHVTTGEVLVPYPVSADIEDTAGRVRFTPTRATSERPIYPTASELDWLESRLPRTERGEACTSPEAIARRLEDAERGRLQNAERGTRIELPARGIIPPLCVAERLIEATARQYLELYALAPSSIPLKQLRGSFRDGAGDFEDHELAAIIERIADDPRGCLYEFDGRGRVLDAKAERDAQRAAANAAKAEVEAAQELEPNTKTAAELGVLVLAVHKQTALRPSFAIHEPHYSDEAHDFYFLDTNAMCGLAPRGQAYSGLTFMPPSFVPAVSNREAKRGGLTLTPAQYLNGRPCDASPITAFRDLSTAEGRWAIERAREVITPIAANAIQEACNAYGLAFGSAGWLPFAIEVAVRGFRIRPDLALDLLFDRFPLNKTACGEGTLKRLARAAVEGHSARVSPDELYTPPPAEVLEAIDASIGVDPWIAVLAQRVADVKEHITTEQLEAWLETRINAPDISQRIGRIMTGLGWQKGRVKGSKKRAFVRVEREEAAS